MHALRNILAPAKLNLFLHVLSKREDGYHELQTVFQLINWYDTLDIERLDTSSIERCYELPGVPADQDLCVKAAKALQNHTQTRFGARIHLTKHIPTGAGLGGGSSDAASVLLALNQLWDLHLTQEELLPLAKSLGADVPFFVYGQNAFASGIGEQLSQIPLPKRFFIVIKPNIHINTATIFNHKGLTRDTKPITIMDFAQQQKTGLGLFGKNDLQTIVFQEFPKIAEIALQIQALTFHEVRMSGSGSSLFLSLKNHEEASCIFSEIQAKILPCYDLKIKLCESLDKHPNLFFN